MTSTETIERVMEFLELCRNAGIRIRLDSGKILIAPKAAICADDADFIRQNRDTIIDVLQWEQEEEWNAEIDTVVRRQP